MRDQQQFEGATLDRAAADMTNAGALAVVTVAVIHVLLQTTITSHFL